MPKSTKPIKINKGGRPRLGDKALAPLSARVPQGVLQAIDRYAREHAKTRSQAVTDLLLRGLDDQPEPARAKGGKR
jgi:hypothetical protein